ncbi:MAG: hypothetical protein V7733_05680 [Paraglaciecola polaris]|uniref:hypothetical protein n=1 Tax=Paraglaciecola polaris TaxID=222814 RepID=UPI00300297C6
MFNPVTLYKPTMFISSMTILFSSFAQAANPVLSSQIAMSFGAHCPTSFYGTVLSNDASACHIFADTLPASLTYHSKVSPNELQAFFRQQIDGPITQSVSQNRILIRLTDNRKIIVISPDGDGSQVDILVNPS